MAKTSRPQAGLPPAAQDSAAIELDIIGINQEGQGIARLDGLAVFVTAAIPGDRVLAQIERRHASYAVARVIRLIRPSPDRVTPACSLAAECGGCSLQMMNYPAQLRQKQQQVIDALRRIGHVESAADLIRPIIGMDEPWQYRSKVQFPVAGSSDDPAIGFFASRSHRVIRAQNCPVQPPVCDIIRETVAAHLVKHQIEPYQESTHSGLVRHIVVRTGFITGDVMVVLAINGDQLPYSDELWAKLRHAVAACRDPQLPPLELKSFFLNINQAQTNQILADECRLIAGQPWIEEIILGLRYRISPLSFFQVNPRQTERLYAAALEMAALTGRETVLDLYCGTGSISLMLARRAARVLGIEIIPEAIEDARRNAEINGISNVEFRAGQAEKLLPTLAAEGLTADVAVVDPPRKGCDPDLLTALIDVQVRRVVYVSCNPATLARDAAILQNGGYRVEAIQPVDMFPWTGHVETVVLMCRAEAGKA